MKILTFVGYYIPGYKSGGPLRTISNMVYSMGDDFEFMIFTSDRDATDTKSYDNIKVNDWNTVGKAQVYYAAPKALSIWNIRTIILESKPDRLYLNSFFSDLTRKCLLLRKLRLIPDIPVVFAPRGEFSTGALQIKTFKKRVYLGVAKLSNLYANLLWQASSEQEANEIRATWQQPIDLQIAPDLPDIASIARMDSVTPLIKTPSSVRFVFISRIAPVKNLGFLLAVLKELHGDVTFSIYGPIRDPNYWNQCQNIISTLPSNIKVIYEGPVPHSMVADVLQENHFFLLPTLGENFGHAIFESISTGIPTVISDRTLWHDMEKHHAGYEVPLEDQGAWVKALQSCVGMSANDYQMMAAGALNYAKVWVDTSNLVDSNQKLFENEQQD